MRGETSKLATAIVLLGEGAGSGFLLGWGCRPCRWGMGDGGWGGMLVSICLLDLVFCGDVREQSKSVEVEKSELNPKS